jgi:hypothetical protein
VTVVNIQEHVPSVPSMNVFYCQWYLGKIFLYVDHNHMEYLYSIIFIYFFVYL